MMRVLTFLATICLTLGAALTAPAAAQAADEAPTIYLDQADGEDKSPGTDPSAPVKTLTQALRLTAPAGGRIVIMSDYRLETSITETAHEAGVVVSSSGGGKTYPGRLIFAEKSGITYNLAGPTTFEDLGIVTSAPAVIAGNFHELAFGESITTKSTADPAVPQISVVGGFSPPADADAALDQDSTITIDSGAFSQVIGFSREKGVATQEYSGTSRITINGGDVKDVFGASFGNHYSGSTHIAVTDGHIDTLHTGGDATRYLTGSARLDLTGGTVDSIDLNNVVGDVDVTLAGTVFDTIQADNVFASAEREESIRNAAATRTVHVDAQSYTADQFDQLRQVFDVLDNTARIEIGSDGSLEEAVASLSVAGGEIVVTGSVSWDVDAQTLAAGAGDLAISGAEGASIRFPEDAVVTTARDLVFTSIELANDGTLELQADGSDLVLGSGTSTVDGSAVSVVGVSDGSRIEVADGDVATVVGIRGSAEDYAGGTSVTISGGSVGEVWGGTDESFKVARSTVTVSGGEVGALHASADLTTESMTVRLLSGTVDEADLDGAAAAVHLRIGAAAVASVSLGDWADVTDAERILTRLPGADQSTIDEVSPAFDEVVEDQFVYVSGGTVEDDADGASPEHPLGDLNAAIDAVGTDGHIVLVTPLTIGDLDLAAHDGRITLTANDGDIDFADDGAALQVEGAMRSGGDLVLENLPLQSPTVNGAIVGMGHPLTIGSGVDTTVTRRGLTYLDIVGGRDDEQATTTTSVSIAGGQWGAVQGGSNQPKAVNAGVDTRVTVSGGVFNGPVVLGHRGEGSGRAEGELSGGTFLQGVYAVYEEDGEPYAADYDVSISVLGGEYWSMIAPAKSSRTELAGSFDVTVSGGDFGHLTDIRGTDVYAGTMTSSVDVDPEIADTTPQGELTFTNPQLSAADPYMFTHDGQYYFIATAGSTMSLRKVANPADLSNSVGSVIFAPDDLKNLWSPEVHHFTAEEVGEENAGWYLYLSAAKNDDPKAEGQRQYVLKALDGDDLLGAWGNPVTGEEGVPQRISSEDDPDLNVDEFMAGISVLRVGGEAHILYVAEEGRGTPEFHQTINLIHMVNPWTLSGEPSVLTRSEYDWEKNGAGPFPDGTGYWPEVVEGATAVYGDDGEIYLAYSASGYWTVYYSIGFLRLSGDDPFDADSWVKNPTPILSKSDTVNGIGTGPTFTDHEGNDWFTYQARTGTTTTSGRFAFFEQYDAGSEALTIGDGSGHPAPMETEYTLSVNPVPLGDKVSGFDDREM